MEVKKLMELVKYCGGEPSRVDDWIKDMEDKEIQTIDELIDYPFKVNYIWIIRKSDAPNFYKVFIDYYFRNIDYFSKHEIIDLDRVLDLLSDILVKGFGEYGFDESDKRCLGVDTQEELEELVELVKKDLIELKFGSMTYDW